MKARSFYLTLVFLGMEMSLCQTCDYLNSVDANLYVEDSFQSLEIWNKTLKVLVVHSDDIYTAGNNGLFHLSKNFEIKSKHLTDEEENIYKILQVSESLGKLVVCSSGGARGCQLRSLVAVNENSSSINTRFHENIVASGQFRTVGVIAPDISEEGSSLYIARSIDRNGADAGNRPVFERKLSYNGNNDRETNAMSTSVQQSFVIYYSNTFSYGGFVYFLASQRDSATVEDSPFVSKLSRVCQNDESENFKAFAELQLACEGGDGSLYSITQSAHQIGEDLYIVFNRNGEVSHEYDPQSQSALCVYNMTEIEQKFEENSYACACNAGTSTYYSNNVYLNRAECGMVFKKNPNFSCVWFPTLRDTVSCSANLGPEVLFSYPEEPQGQAVSSDAIYESSYLTFSSLLVTSVPRDDSKRIAFIGTKEGKLLKVNIGEETCRNYEAVNIGSPILGNTALINNNESLLVLTESKLLKIKVADCSQFTTCDECIRPDSPLGDPYCGWCTLERRCTRSEECPDYNENSRWLPYDEMECIAIAEVTPKFLPTEEHSQELQLKIANLPELRAEESYDCYFNDWITPAIADGGFLNCTSPPMNKIPIVVTGDHVIMQLGVFSSETSKNFVTRDYEFYDCSRIALCSECVISRWKCDWCIFQHKCTYDSGSCKKVIYGAPGFSSDTSADLCPHIIPGVKKLVPNGVDQKFFFQAKNLPVLEDKNVMSYDCHLTAKDNCCADVDFIASATLTTQDNITFTVTCDSRGYSYMRSQQFLDAKLRLKWNTDNTVDNYQPVQLYKCEVGRPDCSRCLSSITTPENLNCVWCEASSTCTVECDGEKTLPGTGVCPAPEITKVSPSTSTLGGGTHVTVTGSNLGKAFSDISSVTLAGEECEPLEDSYLVGESITCVAGSADREITGGVVVETLEQSGDKPNAFSYKGPKIGRFSPERGPQSGGTRVEIMGEHLDTGGYVEVSIGGVPCISNLPRTATNITCKTKAAESIFASNINVTFDKTESKLSDREFSFAADPTVTSIEPEKAILSGGTNLTVTGTSFDLIQRPQIIATFEGREISEDCWMVNAIQLECPTPKVKQENSRKRRQTENTPVQDDVAIGFILDGVTSLKNWTEDEGITFQYFDDPTYYKFKNDEIVFSEGSQDTIRIEGENLNVATSLSDVKVYIGMNECPIDVFIENQLFCNPPIEQPEAGDINGNRNQRGLPFVVVHHGLNLRFDIGYVRYPRDPVVYIITAISVVVLLCLTVVGLFIIYASRSKKKQVDMLLQELDYVKTNVNKELKLFYNTLQIALDKFEASGETIVALQMTDNIKYVKNVLFINTSIQPKDMTEPQKNPRLTEMMRSFSELISIENFLTALLHVLDDDADLSDEKRSNIASFILICCLLEGNIKYLAHVTKIVMSEKIVKADHSCSDQLFCGHRNIIDKLLSNLVAICLYENLSIEIADKILQLFTAMKCIIETGPVDEVTGKSQFSLSFSHMLESQIEFKELKLNVLCRNECDQVVEISFLSVDSITQVKHKILDYFSHGHLTQLRYSPEEFDLVLRNREDGEDEEKILKDDGILYLSDGWRKINTLSDYEVNDGACVELVKKLNNSQRHNNLKEAKHYSFANDGESWSENNQHLKADEGYIVPDEGYLIPDVNKSGASWSENNQHLEADEGYIVPDEGYLIPDVNENGASWSENNQHLKADEGYIVPDEGYLIPDVNEISTDNDDQDSHSESDIKHDYLEENQVYTECEDQDSQSKNSNINYYYPNENSDQRKISSGDDHSIYDEPEAGFGLWVWHLIKDDKKIHGDNIDVEDQSDEINLQEIVRPYLPATGSVLQKYVKNVFDAFMNPAGSHVSYVVKDLFDFFDRKAAEERVPELANKWKSNVLFLGIYSTILTKPTIICDVRQFSYVQACLAVIGQTIATICRNESAGHDDMQGQLFSQLVQVYRTKLDHYYKQITRMKKVEAPTLEAEYAKVEKVFAGACDLLSTQFHLYTMIQNHIDQVCEKLQADAELVQKVRHMQTTLKAMTE